MTLKRTSIVRDQWRVTRQYEIYLLILPPPPSIPSAVQHCSHTSLAYLNRESNLKWIVPSLSLFRWMLLISQMSLILTLCFELWRRDAWCKRFTSVQACSLKRNFNITVWQLQFTHISRHQSGGMYCSNVPLIYYQFTIWLLYISLT